VGTRERLRGSWKANAENDFSHKSRAPRRISQSNDETLQVPESGQVCDHAPTVVFGTGAMRTAGIRQRPTPGTSRHSQPMTRIEASTRRR
jgi:hypothetical protein